MPEKIRVKDEKLKEEMLGKKVAYFANKRAVKVLKYSLFQGFNKAKSANGGSILRKRGSRQD